ncbi:hypothetical protein M9980_09085 [Sphingomonas donggukensis]|uniref:Uncharacterized protein n=1 Tax=Sphingomonas donggukensis TaxID=2949093 RepID=A0ABY4TWP4_9SPHN|nr:hypothetical protein [Sphingomonas donggukensis]URW74728.1 hypothetical protein M9980_09085 [Sphingomonas donggukensis]
MAKADRLERLDTRRVELEAEYRETLIAALRIVAVGKWGLFGHNQDRAARASFAPTLAALDETAIDIDTIRARFGMEPFALHPQFLAARGPVERNAPGEPKQALAWLDMLGADAAGEPAS